MKELKTLKDLEISIPLASRGNTFKKIREEAIKWVKDIRKRADEPENSLNKMTMLSVQGWILKFFNITEEDLK